MFEISGKEITLGAGIGKGSYGEVYQAQWRGITVAGFSFINKFLISHFFSLVKKFPFHLLGNKDFLDDFTKEAKILRFFLIFY